MFFLVLSNTKIKRTKICWRPTIARKLYLSKFFGRSFNSKSLGKARLAISSLCNRFTLLLTHAECS